MIVERFATRRSGGYFVGLFGAGRAAAERLGSLDRLHDRTPPDGATFAIDRLGNRQRGLDLPTWLMLRGDVERAVFTGLPPDLEVRYSTVPPASSRTPTEWT